ncbi:ferrochelatase [Porphyromonas crevioricanis]|uniref:Ferrochelatase n=1 Tax=Porphyromonas crevioricanis TaxID=393921 RepID=A0AB34PJH7_9PORP|nr:ferrochelatase [Porphyromonas crevioricanis]KGN96471.1 hypothetical protein HQ38_01430 [Porphyromonas crevioricanis]
MRLPYDGVILINVGSPASPEIADVAAFLKKFLTDKYVISLPWLWRQILIRGVIIPFRKRKSAAMYQRLWRNSGETFPLVETMERLTVLLESHLCLPIVSAMRYGAPSVQTALRTLRKKNTHELKCLLVVPLFPQFALSGYHTAAEHALSEIRTLLGNQIRIDVLPPFYKSEKYISAVCDVIRPDLERRGCKHLLLAFHSIPVSHLHKASVLFTGHTHSSLCCASGSLEAEVCYQYQCIESSRLISERLNIEGLEVETVFQSQMGHSTWLGPSLKKRLAELAGKGFRQVSVASPGLVCDCLETLDEIGEREKEAFLSLGGESLQLLPCLNASQQWVEALADIIEDYAESLS